MKKPTFTLEDIEKNYKITDVLYANDVIVDHEVYWHPSRHEYVLKVYLEQDGSEYELTFELNDYQQLER